MSNGGSTSEGTRGSLDDDHQENCGNGVVVSGKRKRRKIIRITACQCLSIVIFIVMIIRGFYSPNVSYYALSSSSTVDDRQNQSSSSPSFTHTKPITATTATAATRSPNTARSTTANIGIANTTTTTTTKTTTTTLSATPSPINTTIERQDDDELIKRIQASLLKSSNDGAILEARNQSNPCTLSISGPPILTDYSVGTVVSISQITVQDDFPAYFQLSQSANMSRNHDNDNSPPTNAPTSPWTILQRHNTSSSYATCAYKCFNYCDHFPHFAQQLYRCVSFWYQYPNHQPVFRTLPTDSKLHQRAVRKTFTAGLLRWLPQVGVIVVPNDKTDTQTRVRADHDRSVSVRTIRPQQHYQGSPFQTASVDAMISFRDNIVNAILSNDEGHKQQQQQQQQGRTFCPSSPRIAVINRLEKRHIHNADAIIEEVQSAFALPYQIPIHNFEHASFEEQVVIWSSIDIVITPHGAQETGLIFLPKCGGVLEFLPGGYYYPNYFGSLAASSGKHHAFLYMSKNQSDHSCHHDNVNGPVYRGDWCPPEDSIRHGVAILLQQWKECCQKETKED